MVYDGILLVGPQPELSGDHPWCTVLAGLHQHIYRGHDDMAHCPPQTLGSWDCQEWIEALHHMGSLSSTQSGWRRASQPQRRSQSSSQCCSQMPAQGTRDGHSCGPSPHMPLRCHHGATSPPCTPSRCCCSMAISHNICTTPKVASAVNVPTYTWYSHSGEGMARASLDQDEALEDDFQTQHTPVHCVMQREDDSHQSSAEGRLEHSGGSPGQQTDWRQSTPPGGPPVGCG